MTKEAFRYLWEQGIVKAANNVVSEIPTKIQKKYNVKLEISDKNFSKVYEEYNKFRKEIRDLYFDVGTNDENLIDGHKICACITGSLINVHLVSFFKNEKNVPMQVICSNYAIAFLSGIYVQYLFLLSDYMRDNDMKNFNKLKEQATFYFPETNPGHDSYVCGRIKTLALNDIYGNDFDVLTYADMLFWIEKYNKFIISQN